MNAIPRRPRTRAAQRGAALIVGLIMLVLIMLTVSAAFVLSGTNLQAVGNLQTRNEAEAAANRAIEEVIGSLLLPSWPSGCSASSTDRTCQPIPSMVAPTRTQSDVDINNDGTTDYKVQIEPPECVRAMKVTGSATATAGAAGGVVGGASSDPLMNGAPEQYSSVWNITATVADATTGASMVIRQGVRVLLDKKQYAAFCTAPLVPPAL